MRDIIWTPGDARIPVFFMPPTVTQNGFQALNLPDRLIQRLNGLRITTPTPIQAEAIPHALLGRDVVGIAQTGTGKTFAFGLPILSRLAEKEQALVLAPTRELAMQISDSLRSLGATTALVIGGASMRTQVETLRNRPSVIVATPGRLKDHLHQRTVTLHRVTIAVLDEADRMLDMGFAPDIRRILENVPAERQTLLFSATMPPEISDLAARYQRDPIRVEVTPPGTTVERVDQELIVLPKEEKHDMLADLLREFQGSMLVFTRTRHGARKLAKVVRNLGHSAAELHSDRTLAQRKAALEGFKARSHRILVATDIAARGIDVKEIELVVNFDLPSTAEDYVHRIGRTGRAGAPGRAITMVTPEQSEELHDLEKKLPSPLPRSPRGSVELPARPKPLQVQFRRRSGPRRTP